MKVAITVLGSLLVLVCALVYTRDPGEGYGLPPCSFKELTGYHCPGCGGTRSFHALLHGRVGDAFYFNPLFIVGLAIGGMVALWLIIRRRCLGRDTLFRMSTRQGIVLAVAIIGSIFGFGIIRNFPWYPWLKAPIHEAISSEEVIDGQ